MILATDVQAVVIDEPISLAINAAMLAVTIISVICAFLVYFFQKNRSKKDAACKLAKHYAEDILEQYSFIASVFRRAGLDIEIGNAIDFKDLRNFDKDELIRILRKNKVAYDAFIKSIDDIDPTIILECKVLRTNAVLERHSTIGALADKYDESKELTDKDKDFLQKHLRQSIVDYLNSLEWFCMNCRYRLADEKLLYQSLQKTFLSAVWLLSPIICHKNTNNADKLYTNVIWLFTKWRARLTKIRGKAEKKKKALKRKAAKAEEKAKAIKEKVYRGKPM